MQNKKQKYLEKQLAEYEKKTSMTGTERKELRRWVKAGHSVYEYPGSRYLCDPGIPASDFLDAYRRDAEIGKMLEGKTTAEKAAWLRSYCGYEDRGDDPEPTVNQMKEQIRRLERELVHLWEYVGQEGLYSEAKEYVDDTADTPVPFE